MIGVRTHAGISEESFRLRTTLVMELRSKVQGTRDNVLQSTDKGGVGH